jgi:copper chaperone CopZ
MALFGKTTTIHLEVSGMTCGNCVKHVTEALESVAGVKRVQVDLEKHEATVAAKADTDVGSMLKAVEAAGYQATPKA